MSILRWIEYNGYSFNGAQTDIEGAQEVVKTRLSISEHEGDIRKYRASYCVYLRPPSEAQTQHRDVSLFIGRVGVGECREYGTPFPDKLTIAKDVLEKEKILKVEVGYVFLPTAWGKGYATEALKAVVETFSQSYGLWNPPFEKVYVLGVAGGANLGSRRVMEKAGFKFNGVHKWEGEEVFIGGAMQPPEVCVYSFGPASGK